MEKEPIKSHEDLEVYKMAFDVAMKIFELSKKFPIEERYSLKNRQGSRELLARGIEQNWDSTPSERELLNRSRGLRPMLRSATR